MSGKVYLVGAGPGDPELITLKAARVLGQAQVVVYDFLVNPQLLQMAPPQAQLIYVGKKGGEHTKAQEDINELLCDLAAQGRMVVRLKGGDPFVFGRGGEEASALAARGLAFEVIPGISSAIAGPAYAGIPVTDRRCSTEVALVTGHEDPTKPESTINWEALAGMGSLVFLMGVKNLEHICAELIRRGKAPDTPAACIHWATTPQQQTVLATLQDLPQAVARAGIKHPAITVVGPVAALRSELNWYERLPLFGRRVLVTRTRSQASRLSQALISLGAQPVEVPTIRIEPPPDPAPLARAAQELESYQLVILTSVNGVQALFEAMRSAGRDARALAGARVCAIGPATAQALSAQGIEPDLTPRTFVAEGLLEALEGMDLKGSRVLIPRALEARPLLPDTLRQRGAQVEVVPAYRTVLPEDSAGLLHQALDQGLDAVTFTASSTVANLMALAQPEQRRQLAELSQQDRLLVAAIGPITAQTATEQGLKVHLQPQDYTIEALVEALARHFGQT